MPYRPRPRPLSPGPHESVHGGHQLLRVRQTGAADVEPVEQNAVYPERDVQLQGLFPVLDVPLVATKVVVTTPLRP